MAKSLPVKWTREHLLIALNLYCKLPFGSFNASNAVVKEVAAKMGRSGQQFFRQAVLNAYDVRCCISGINVPDLLIASHIKPWGKFPNDRLNPRNGLCLSKLHDAAFDGGLITLDGSLKVVLSSRLRKFFPQPALEQNFVPFEGRPIRLPEKLAEPDAEFLRYHREVLFQS
jgi:predicted restriction endonuclease